MEQPSRQQAVTAQEATAERTLAASATVRVEAGSRLHFGLMALDPASSHAFGGIGLYVEQPRLVLEVERCGCLCATGPHAGRAARVARRLAEALAARGTARVPPVALRIVTAPPEHCGFGLGTQLSLAVAAALVQITGHPEPAVRFAASLGRGRRSHVGIAAFASGGFVLDRGQLRDRDRPRTETVPYPEPWRIVVVLPQERPAVHGRAEEQLIERARPGSERLTQALYAVATSQVLPAVRHGDFAAFCRSLEQYGLLAGRMFERVQGGVWRSKLAPELAKRLRERFGVPLVQSSWGPVLAVPAQSERQARMIAAEIRAGRLGQPVRLWITPARNRGADTTVLDSPSR